MIPENRVPSAPFDEEVLKRRQVLLGSLSEVLGVSQMRMRVRVRVPERGARRDVFRGGGRPRWRRRLELERLYQLQQVEHEFLYRDREQTSATQAQKRRKAELTPRHDPYLVVCPLQLPDRIRAHSPISETLSRTEQLERVVHLDFVPHREQRLDGLLRLARVGPNDRLEELGQGALVARQVEAEFPDEVALWRRQFLSWRVAQDFLPGKKAIGSARLGSNNRRTCAGPTLSSSRILAFGFSSRSSGPFRWSRTKRRCFASTGFFLTISGSTIVKREASAAACATPLLVVAADPCAFAEVAVGGTADEYRLDEERTGSGYSCVATAQSIKSTANQFTHAAKRTYGLAEHDGKVEARQVDVEKEVVRFLRLGLRSKAVVSAVQVQVSRQQVPGDSPCVSVQSGETRACRASRGGQCRRARAV